MIGMFPLVPGEELLGLHTPLFPEVRLEAPGRPPVTVTCDGAGPYTSSLAVDGVPSTRAWTRFSDLVGGARLRFRTSTAPTDWATDPADEPPSATPPAA